MKENVNPLCLATPFTVLSKMNISSQKSGITPLFAETVSSEEKGALEIDKKVAECIDTPDPPVAPN